jgi:hypothetical protein
VHAAIPDVLTSLGMGFLPAPTLDPRSPSTSFRVRGRELRVDLLTPLVGRSSDSPIYIPAFNACAQPVRFLDYCPTGTRTRAGARRRLEEVGSRPSSRGRFSPRRISATVRPMSASTAPAPPDLETERLERQYLAGLRQRFKHEVNRLTGGAMRGWLEREADADDLAFLLSYLYAYHWLRHHVHPSYRRALLAPFRGPKRAFLMDLLDGSADAAAFVRGYVERMLASPGGTLREREPLERLLVREGGDPERLVARVLALWSGLGLLTRTPAEGYRALGREERERYHGMLGPEDQERLALVDALPDAQPGPARFAKLGVVPAMGCPQTCRHCMFIWRPPMRATPDPRALFEVVAGHTESVLFTGGDLSRHLDLFLRAIREMAPVRTFAILLNGDFAQDPETTERVLAGMAAAVRARPLAWAPARVLLQVSFDEFHQEVIVDPRGRLRERIPVARIAHIVECAPRHPEVQLCLVHKQTPLGFSGEVFRQGVFGRLVEELGRRGHQVQVLAASPSPRLKRNPLDPGRVAPVLKDASFVLANYPDRPVLLTSSTVDGYGRASLLEEGETVKERDLLEQVLREGPPPGEAFDTDLMLWLNGWVTLFSAVHVCLGDLYRDGAERIFARHRKDPLTAALHRFDRRLLALYAEVGGDLAARVAAATGPHHLFHTLTEDPAVRLHLTRRLAADPR